MGCCIGAHMAACGILTETPKRQLGVSVPFKSWGPNDISRRDCTATWPTANWLLTASHCIHTLATHINACSRTSSSFSVFRHPTNDVALIHVPDVTCQPARPMTISLNVAEHGQMTILPPNTNPVPLHNVRSANEGNTTLLATTIDGCLQAGASGAPVTTNGSEIVAILTRGAPTCTGLQTLTRVDPEWTKSIFTEPRTQPRTQP